MAQASSTQPVLTPALIIRHKADAQRPTRTITKKARAATTNALAIARVKRPGLTDWLLDGSLFDLPLLTQYEIDSAGQRPQDISSFYVVPADSIGRAPKNGERDWASTAESVRLWVKKYLCDTDAPAFRASEFSVIHVLLSE